MKLKNIIQYLLSLDPRDRIVAAMMVVISFLVLERSKTEYEFSEYRTKKENQITKLQKENATEIINYYNHLIEGQVSRADQIKEQNSRLDRIDSILSHMEKTKKNEIDNYRNCNFHSIFICPSTKCTRH